MASVEKEVRSDIYVCQWTPAFPSLVSMTPHREESKNNIWRRWSRRKRSLSVCVCQLKPGEEGRMDWGPVFTSNNCILTDIGKAREKGRAKRPLPSSIRSWLVLLFGCCLFLWFREFLHWTDNKYPCSYGWSPIYRCMDLLSIRLTLRNFDPWCDTGIKFNILLNRVKIADNSLF